MAVARTHMHAHGHAGERHACSGKCFLYIICVLVLAWLLVARLFFPETLYIGGECAHTTRMLACHVDGRSCWSRRAGLWDMGALPSSVPVCYPCLLRPAYINPDWPCLPHQSGRPPAATQRTLETADTLAVSRALRDSCWWPFVSESVETSDRPKTKANGPRQQKARGLKAKGCTRPPGPTPPALLACPGAPRSENRGCEYGPGYGGCAPSVIPEPGELACTCVKADVFSPTCADVVFYLCHCRPSLTPITGQRRRLPASGVLRQVPGRRIRLGCRSCRKT